MSHLSHCLLCLVCDRPLALPTTLSCGHTVCARHLSSSSAADKPTACPVPACIPPTRSPLLPNIPSSSNVRYEPAPHVQPPPPPMQPNPEPKLDVTVSKVLALLARPDLHAPPPEFLPQVPPDNDERSDDEDEDEDGEQQDDDTSPSGSHPRPSTSQPPRKRRRHLPPEPAEASDDDNDDLLAHLRRQADHSRTVRTDDPIIPHDSPQDSTDRFLKELLAELTCEICFVLLYQPVTTPCQHTFCAKCLQRSLDYSQSCPICRDTLPAFSYFQEHPVNKTVLSLILEAFPTIYKEHGEAIEQEERDRRLDTPIFIAHLSFPGMPTFLHFFEPRYRLMLRRCLESPNPSFGMVMPSKPGGASPHTEYGTMLSIRSVQMLPDGRSLVETWGTFRFRILERGSLDGYTVARIERIDDYPLDLTEPPRDPEVAPSELDTEATTSSLAPPAVTLLRPSPSASTSSSSPSSSISSSASSSKPSVRSPPRRREPTNAELITTCHTFLRRLQLGAAPWVVQRLSSEHGPMPTDPSAFSFWVALVLPIDEQEKAKLLPLRSTHLRLLMVVHWIEELNNNWYAWLCFVVRDGWILDGPAGPVAIWIALVLMVFRFLFGWI